MLNCLCKLFMLKNNINFVLVCVKTGKKKSTKHIIYKQVCHISTLLLNLQEHRRMSFIHAFKESNFKEVEKEERKRLIWKFWLTCFFGCVQIGFFLSFTNIFLVPYPFVTEPIWHLKTQNECQTSNNKSPDSLFLK